MALYSLTLIMSLDTVTNVARSVIASHKCELHGKTLAESDLDERSIFFLIFVLTKQRDTLTY